jgi:hypothetical protein
VSAIAFAALRPQSHAPRRFTRDDAVELGGGHLQRRLTDPAVVVAFDNDGARGNAQGGSAALRLAGELRRA